MKNKTNSKILIKNPMITNDNFMAVTSGSIIKLCYCFYNLCCCVGKKVKNKNKENLVEKRYQLLNQIGKGKFGMVYAAKCKSTEKEVAIKYIFKNEINKIKTKREIEVLNLLKTNSHLNINIFYENLEIEDAYCLVLEKCLGCELFDGIIEKGIFSENDSITIIKQLCLGIDHLHSLNIIHRDIKPENIIFDKVSYTVKIIDFGLSIIVDNHSIKKYSIVGTSYYMAPEIFTKYYCYLCDEWSLGVIWFILITGYPPFYGDNESVIKDKIVKQNPNYVKKEWENVSIETLSLVRDLLTKNIRKRKTVDYIFKNLSKSNK